MVGVAVLGESASPDISLFSNLNEAERRAYILAVNKLAVNADWDRNLLAIELQGLIDLDFDMELTGFSLAEIDFTIDKVHNAEPDRYDACSR